MSVDSSSASTPAMVEPQEDPLSARVEWERTNTQRALDELFSTARKYRGTKEFKELLDFTVKFRSYAPFNAMLTHVQMPGAVFVAPAHRWLSEYGRRVTVAARPLVILQPMGPVMFVFDVSDTEPVADAPQLPVPVIAPFETRGANTSQVLALTIANAVRDGVRTSERQEGSQSAGSIRVAPPGSSMSYTVRVRPEVEAVQVPVRFEMLSNAKQQGSERYATIVHELAHLYCGHLGTPSEKWWPNRRHLSDDEMEFEAESISYLVCQRLGIETRAAQYLETFIGQNADVPDISLDLVMKVAGLIEQMGRERMPLRKEPLAAKKVTAR